jgi:hypothetical protein
MQFVELFELQIAGSKNKTTLRTFSLADRNSKSDREPSGPIVLARGLNYQWLRDRSIIDQLANPVS